MAIKTRIPNVFLTGLQSVMSNFEDLTGTTRPLWRDYSKYDLAINLDVAKLNGVNGAAFRNGIGWSGIDPTFQGRWDRAGDMDNFYRTEYDVLYPSLSVPRMCDHWFQLNPEIDVIPRVLDAELQDGQSDAVVGEKIWEAFELVYAHDGVYPWLYSRYLLIDKWLKYWTPEMLSTLKIWGARYLWDRTREHPGPPYGTMYNLENKINANQWIMHQTADKKAPYPGETERSTIVDWDRWELGTVEEMNEWIAENYGKDEPPIDPPPEPPPEGLEEWIDFTDDRLDTIEVWIEDHETDHCTNDPSDSSDTLTVTVKENFALAVPVGHDAKGKPILEPPSPGDSERVSLKKNDIFDIKSKAKYSDADNANTPVIFATGRVPFYEVADGQSGSGQYAKASKVSL